MRLFRQMAFVPALFCFLALLKVVPAAHKGAEEAPSETTTTPPLQKGPAKYEWEEGYVDPEEEPSPIKAVEKPEKRVSFAKEVQVLPLHPIKPTPGPSKEKRKQPSGQTLTLTTKRKHDPESSEEAEYEGMHVTKEDPYNLDVQAIKEIQAYGSVEKHAQPLLRASIMASTTSGHEFPKWVIGEELPRAFSKENPSIIGELRERTEYFPTPVEKPKLVIKGGAKSAMPICPPDAFLREELLTVGNLSATWKARHVNTGLPVLRKDVVISIKQHAEFDMQYRMSRMTEFVPTIYCIRTDPPDHTYYHFDEVIAKGEKLEWPVEWRKNIPEPQEIDQVRVSPSGIRSVKRIKPRKKIRPVTVLMEYVGGGDFFNFLQKFGIRPYDHLEKLMVVQYLAEMYAIISRIHELGVLHLDIKPENFVIGEDGHLRAIDFGMSLRRKQGGVSAGHQGTPMYMSPEMRSGKLLDETADYYAYGVTMYVVFERRNDFRNIKKAVFTSNTMTRAQEAITGLTHDDPSVRREYWLSLPKKFPLFARIDWEEMKGRAYGTS